MLDPPPVSVYVYNDGFMYYTKAPFVKGTTDMEHNITTGYIDRSVYAKNPLTHGDLRKYLDSHRNLNKIEQNMRNQGLTISKLYFDRIYHLLREVFLSYVGNICGGTKLNENLTFQLFGIDIAVDDTLNPTIMEINKGPDMGAKDKRDYQVKYNVLQDMMKLVKVITPTKTNGFIKLFKYENNNVHY